MKKSKTKKKEPQLKKKRETEGPRAAAVCGWIREGGLPRRNEALMDKDTEMFLMLCCVDHVYAHTVGIVWLCFCIDCCCVCIQW